MIFPYKKTKKGRHIMKKLFFSAASVFGVLLLCSACFNIKTENEIKPIEVKPIHITIDINVKIDKALDDFFGDIDEEQTAM